MQTQLKTIYLRDIVKRHELNNDEKIGEILDIIASGISSLVNPLKLENTFKSVKNSSITVNTVTSYIEHLEEAFIVSTSKRYDVKGKNILVLLLNFILKILV